MYHLKVAFFKAKIFPKGGKKRPSSFPSTFPPVVTDKWHIHIYYWQRGSRILTDCKSKIGQSAPTSFLPSEQTDKFPKKTKKQKRQTRKKKKEDNHWVFDMATHKEMQRDNFSGLLFFSGICSVIAH